MEETYLKHLPTESEFPVVCGVFLLAYTQGQNAFPQTSPFFQFWIDLSAFIIFCLLVLKFTKSIYLLGMCM